MCREPIGKQDQYATALGGFRHVRFHEDDTVTVESLAISEPSLVRLNARLLLFYTRISRAASPILRRQGEEVETSTSKQAVMKVMAAQCATLRRSLESGDVSAVGSILDEAWQLKRGLSDGISNTAIDEWYARARAAGAAGGKLLGAGGGGFLLFYVEPEHHESVARALADLKWVPIRIGAGGSKVMLNTT
jgi:D-glycero-alpha-D-manno-heptose-7-phosphate kinase